MGQDGSIATVACAAAGGATLSLSGSVTILVADRLLEAAREAATHGDVTVDLGGVDHIDTAGIQVLLALRRTLHDRSHALQLANVPDRVERFLTLAALAEPLGVRTKATGPETGEDSR